MSGSTDNSFSPQLVMRIDPLAGLPPVALPEGYSIRHYRPGDEANWDRIIGESFDWPVDDRDGVFAKRIASDQAFRPDRVLFVTCGEEAVATASAWHIPQCGPEMGYLHYVGTLPSHTGKGLGLQVSLACLHKMVEEGRECAQLQTDDFRIPAVRTYLKLGFHPLLVHENQRERWPNVFRAMGKPELIERYADVISGPVRDMYKR